MMERVDRVDRGINVVLVAVAIMTACSLALLAIAAPAIFSSRNNTSEVVRGNEMAACRSQVAGRVNRAMGDVLSTKAELDVLFASGLQATVLGDKERTRQLAEDVPTKSQRVTDAVQHHREALNNQQDLNELSRVDPNLFLARCRDGF